MSAEPRNAATERLEFHVAVLHKTAALPRSLYTDDFVSEDHRRLIRPGRQHLRPVDDLAHRPHEHHDPESFKHCASKTGGWSVEGGDYKPNERTSHMKRIIATGAFAALATVGFAGTASAFEPGTPQCFGQVHKAVNDGALSGSGIDNVGQLVQDSDGKGQGKNATAKSLC